MRYAKFSAREFNCESFKIETIFLKLVELYKSEPFLQTIWNFPWKRKTVFAWK